MYESGRQPVGFLVIIGVVLSAITSCIYLQAFWDDLFSAALQWGLVVYEQVGHLQSVGLLL